MRYVDFLRGHLEASGEPLVAFAHRAGISPAALYKILTHKTNPRLTSIEKTLRAAGYRMVFIPDGSVTSPNPSTGGGMRQ